MEMLTDLYPYQSVGVDKLSHLKVGALYMDMGTGKTRTALELIKRRYDAGKITQVLWLCPYSFSFDLPELLSEHVTGIDGIFKICGIESLSSSVRLNVELRKYVNSAPTYLIIDESLLIKNPMAYRSQNIIALSKYCPYKIILNGTPISRNAADLFSQWYALDWRILGYQSYWSFAANHLEFDPKYPGRVTRALNVDYLAAKIAPYTFEVRKEDVLPNLPPRNISTYYFRLTDEQYAHYLDVSEQLLFSIEESRPETIYRLFGALQAITSGFALSIPDVGKIVSYVMYPADQNPRIQALLSSLDDFGDEQVIIYCKYTQEIYDIVSLLNKRNPGCAIPYCGELSPKQRHKNKTLFKTGAAQYFVANKSCARFGLNLQFCWNAIFYNNDWDWATRIQAEDRIYRIGQNHAVKIIDILAENTIDETIDKCLRGKSSLAASFRDAVRKRGNTVKALQGMIHGGAI